MTPPIGSRVVGPCARCDGRGHGPSAPSGKWWWLDEMELRIHRLLDAADVPDAWDGPGSDERDEVECPICGGTGLVEITQAAPEVTDDNHPF